MYVLFFKERLHKVQDCSPQKKNNPQYDRKETESRESLGIFLYLMDSYEYIFCVAFV